MTTTLVELGAENWQNICEPGLNEMPHRSKTVISKQDIALQQVFQI